MPAHEGRCFALENDACPFRSRPGCFEQLVDECQEYYRANVQFHPRPEVASYAFLASDPPSLISPSLYPVALSGRGRRSHPHFDLTRSAGDRLAQDINQRQMLGQHESIVRLKHANQGFFQLSPFGFQAALRQIGEQRRVALPSQQGFEHGSCGLAQNIASHVSHLEVGILQHLLEAVDCTSTFLQQAGSGSILGALVARLLE